MRLIGRVGPRQASKRELLCGTRKSAGGNRQTRNEKINGKGNEERQKSRPSHTAPFSKKGFSTDSLAMQHRHTCLSQKSLEISL
jgi:hypothetical protein